MVRTMQTRRGQFEVQNSDGGETALGGLADVKTAKRNQKEFALDRLPRNVLLVILRIVDKELRGSDGSKHDHGLKFGNIENYARAVVDCKHCNPLLPLRLVSRMLRSVVDEAIQEAMLFGSWCSRYTEDEEPEGEAATWDNPVVAISRVDYFLHRTLPKWSNLTTLRIEFDWDPEYLMHVLVVLQFSCPRLEALEILYIGDSIDPRADIRVCLVDGLSSLKCLTKLTVDRLYWWVDWSIEINELTSLKVLKAVVSDLGSHEVLYPMPGLKSLTLKEPAGGFVNDLDLSVLSGFASLVTLDLDDARISSLSLPATLKTVMLTGGEVIELSVVGPLLDLEEVTLKKSTFTCDPTPLLANVNLKALVIEACTMPTISIASSLTSLTLTDIPTLRLPDLRGHTQMETLQLHKVGDAAPSSMLKLPPSLRFLSVEGCTTLRLANLDSLVQLRYFKLVASKHGAVPWFTFTKLQTLEYGGYPRLSTPNLDHLTGLTRLTLQRMPELRDGSRLELLTGLQHLSISECPQLPPLDLSNLKCLQTVSLGGQSIVLKK